MSFFPDPSTIVNIGGVSLKWSLLTTVLGCILGFLMISRNFRKNGYKQTTTDDLLILSGAGCIIGGRAVWVVENWHSYSLYAWGILEFSDGGFDYAGILLGILVAIGCYTFTHRMSYRRTCDAILPGAITAIAFSRIGKIPEAENMWMIVAMDAVVLLILYFGVRPFHEGKRRGDMTSVALMLAGIVQLISCTFHLDPSTNSSVIAPSLAMLSGLGMYLATHSLPIVKPVVLFDFDGTLMDSEYLVINGFAYLFKKHRTLEEFTREIQREVFLHPLREELARLFPEENTEVLAREYRNYMKGIQGRHLVETLPHVRETLKQLKESGYVLGIVTGRYTDSCMMWLEDLLIDQYFDIVAGTETYRHTKPSPDGILHTCEMLKVGHDSVVYVGDGVKDVQAGRNAGVYTVAFVTNEDKRNALEKASPNAVMNSFDELPEILSRQNAWSADLY